MIEKYRKLFGDEFWRSIEDTWVGQRLGENNRNGGTLFLSGCGHRFASLYYDAEKGRYAWHEHREARGYLDGKDRHVMKRIEDKLNEDLKIERQAQRLDTMVPVSAMLDIEAVVEGELKL